MNDFFLSRREPMGNPQLLVSRHEVALKQRSQSLRHRCYPPVFVELSFRPLKVVVAPDEGLAGGAGERENNAHGENIEEVETY